MDKKIGNKMTPDPRLVSPGRSGYMIAAVVYAVVVALIIGIPCYRTFVAPWGQTILQVGETTFTMREFVKRLRLKMPPSEENKLAAATNVLQEMQHTELMRQEALRRDIRVTEAEIDREIKRRVKATAAGGGNFEDLYEVMLRGLRLEEVEYRRWIGLDIYRAKLFYEFLEKAPKAVEHVQIYAIVTDSAKKADAVRVRLIRGENFSDLAKETSIDLESAKAGGNLGWMPKGVDELETPGQFRAIGILLNTEKAAGQIREKILKGENIEDLARTNSLDDETREKGGDLGWVSLGEGSEKPFAYEAYELNPGDVSRPLEGFGGYWIIRLIEKSPAGSLIDDVAFNLPVGEISPPLNTTKGFYLIRVAGRGVRSLSQNHRVIRAEKMLAAWARNAAKKGAEEGWITWAWGSRTYNWVIDHLD